MPFGVPSDSLDISRPVKLISVVCVQSLNRKDGEALPKLVDLTLGSIFAAA